MDAEQFVFAGGGTGGHLFPGIAVAEEVRRLVPSAEILFLTTTRPLDVELLRPTGLAQRPQPVRPFSVRPWDWPRFWWNWRVSVADARRVIQTGRTRAVLGLGGYAAGPAVVAAAQLGVRSAILNPDAIPGRSNRYLARRTHRVILQWAESRAHFGDSVKCKALGCPIRKEFQTADAAFARSRFGLVADRPLLVVTGASQGARTVNEALLAVWPEFARRHPEWQLLHLSGAADEQRVREAYRRENVGATVVAFTHDMPHVLAAADLVVSRAGASTLAELTALGKPSILMPYPYHRDRHQHANAQVLVDAGAALLVDDRRDAALNGPPLAQALLRLANDDARRCMATAAGAMGRPDAARVVAEWLVGDAA